MDVSLTDDHPARALHAPFSLPADVHPRFGSCSRCGADAIEISGRWSHDAISCAPRYGVAAEFVPDDE